MRTEELVAMLARGPVAADIHTTERCLGMAAAAGAGVAALSAFAILGVRPDLAWMLQHPAFWIKLAFPATLALAAFAASCRMARPGARLGVTRVALVGPIVVVLVVAWLALLSASPGERIALVAGHTALECVVSVGLLALPVFAAAFVALRRLAPTRPRAAGALAGLLGGGIAATVYAFHCDEMQAPFVAVWYSLGMSIPVLIGATLGPRLLRWA